jgi:hypothetical protein
VLPGEAQRVEDRATPATERRAVPRVRPRQLLDAKVLSIQPARVIDISSRGAQIEVAGMLHPSGRCDLRIQFAEGEFSVHATVQRCRASGYGVGQDNEPTVLYRAGLEFDELAPECLAWLSSNVLFQAES